MYRFSSAQSLSHVWLFSAPWTAARRASLLITNSWSLHNLMSTESVMPSNHLMLCHPLLFPIQSFPALGSFPMSQLFPSGGQNIGASASSEYSGLISFRIDWFDLLAIQGTLKSVLQHCNSWGCKESDTTERLNWTELGLSLLSFQEASDL